MELLDEERTIYFWYTYDLDGNPLWLIAQGVATADYYEGMVFGEFDTATRNLPEWGTIILDFSHLERAALPPVYGQKVNFIKEQPLAHHSGERALPGRKRN